MPRPKAADPSEAVTLRLPRSTWAKIDASRKKLGLGRVAWLRAAVAAGLAYGQSGNTAGMGTATVTSTFTKTPGPEHPAQGRKLASVPDRKPEPGSREVADKPACPHPKEKRRVLGYMTICGVCQATVR